MFQKGSVEAKLFGSKGGKRKGRGYLGYLKDTDPKKLKQITSLGGKKSKK